MITSCSTLRARQLYHAAGSLPSFGPKSFPRPVLVRSGFSIRLSHSATPEATTAFLASHPSLPTATLSKRGLMLSKLGFGAYRVSGSQLSHTAALVKAIQSGVNVIDTSSHFGHGKRKYRANQSIIQCPRRARTNTKHGTLVPLIGASETFIGNTLEDLFKQDKVKREVKEESMRLLGSGWGFSRIPGSKMSVLNELHHLKSAHLHFILFSKRRNWWWFPRPDSSFQPRHGSRTRPCPM